MTDPYKVLGLSPDATDDEVKKAYRNLSRKYHPDANINNPHKEQAEEMFKIVQQAYKQIMDERSGKIPSYGQGNPYEDPYGNPYGTGSFDQWYHDMAEGYGYSGTPTQDNSCGRAASSCCTWMLCCSCCSGGFPIFCCC